MADKKITELTASVVATGDDLLLIVNDPDGTPATRKITVRGFFSNVSTTTGFSANVSISGTKATVSANTTFSSQLILPSSTPASNNATSEGKLNKSFWCDANYLYIATDATTIKRVSLSSF